MLAYLPFKRIYLHIETISIFSKLYQGMRNLSIKYHVDFDIADEFPKIKSFTYS